MKQMNEQAVSPVIAVILMVAITVVLAGVLYVWVSGLAETGDEEVEIIPLEAKDAGPDVDDVMFYLRHTGGDPLPLDEYTIQVGPDGSECQVSLATDVYDWTAQGHHDVNSTWDATNKTMNVNERAYFAPSCLEDGDVNNGDRIHIILINRESGKVVWEDEITVYDQ